MTPDQWADLGAFLFAIAGFVVLPGIVFVGAMIGAEKASRHPVASDGEGETK